MQLHRYNFINNVKTCLSQQDQERCVFYSDFFNYDIGMLSRGINYPAFKPVTCPTKLPTPVKINKQNRTFRQRDSSTVSWKWSGILPQDIDAASALAASNFLYYSDLLISLGYGDNP